MQNVRNGKVLRKKIIKWGKGDLDCRVKAYDFQYGCHGLMETKAFEQPGRKWQVLTMWLSG